MGACDAVRYLDTLLKRCAIGWAVLAGAEILLALAVGKLSWPLIWGLLLGTLFSFANLALLVRTTANALDKQDHAVGYIRLHYVLRYLLTGVVIALGFAMDFLSPWGIIPPLLLPRIVFQFSGHLAGRDRHCSE
ncbi:MAG TPA: ATP synthase subunit I [Firmicutes bacterium]|nr:ATP synthase subunit I [Bacillota bacterium]